MILKYNLQYFAKDGPGGEKTEPATDKKLTDARKEGQVAKSKEIGNALGLITLFLVLKIWVGSIGTSLLGLFENIYGWIPEMVKLYNGMIPAKELLRIVGNSMWRILVILFPIFIIGVFVAFIGDYIQVKWKFTTKPLKPKFSKMNPLKGLKKIVSMQSLKELILSAVKIWLILYITYTTMEDQWEVIFLFYDMPLNQAIYLIGNITINLGLKIALIYLIIGFADFAYQKWKFKDDMKMTKQEIKDEYKNAEGDPQIKGKIRQKMREASRRRMMINLPQADVVITNPTHFAVAIKYNPEESDAPIVIAKGEDFLAQKIKEIAKEHHIEIVENKPLARMLYANVEIGEMVPPELYQAVAEILAMVYHLQGKV